MWLRTMIKSRSEKTQTKIPVFGAREHPTKSINRHTQCACVGELGDLFASSNACCLYMCKQIQSKNVLLHMQRTEHCVTV